MTNDIVKHFWSKVDIRGTDDCWEWKAGTNNGYKSLPYGRFGFRGENWRAHRVAWTLTYGEILKGLCICHRCDNPGCCNPSHLFQGTRVDNIKNMVEKGRQNTCHRSKNNGEKNGRSKLTEKQVLLILDLCEKKVPRKEIATDFNVSYTTVTEIFLGHLWNLLTKRGGVLS